MSRAAWLRLALLLAPLALAPLASPAQEAPALPYATTLHPTGEASLDGLLAEASRLIGLAGEAPVDAFGLVARARAEPRALEEVLRSEGYWAPRIEVRVAGEPAETPGLPDRVAALAAREAPALAAREAPAPAAPGDAAVPAPGAAALPAGEPVPVEIRVTPGPRYAYRRVALRPDAPAADAVVAALPPPEGIAAGQPARAGPVLDAEAALLDRLRRMGHPLAAIVDREVVVDHEAQAMDVTWTLAPGPRAAFARPEVTGETLVNPRLLDRVAGRLEGAPYSPARLDQARRELTALGAFDAVRARAADRLDAAGRLPVTFAVTDRPRNAAGVNLAYETNFGPSGRVYYERRNLFGNAERLRLEAEVSRLGAGGGTEDVNYRLGASFRRPGLIDGRTTLAIEAAGIRERLEAYDRDVVTTAILLERPFGERWTLRAGPTFETGRIGRAGSLEPFTLAGFVMGASYDGADSLLDPRRGWRLDAAVTPYADIAEGGGFVRALGTIRHYIDVTGDGGSVLALRGSLGSLVGASRAVPLDKRFYAGGGGSVRGFGYQEIGPRDAANRPDGGSSLVEGSVEWRQRVAGPFGVVGFLDAGSLGTTAAPDLSDVRFGVGLGLRYATVIGPIRLDVATPLDRRRDEAGYGLYIGLGQAF